MALPGNWVLGTEYWGKYAELEPAKTAGQLGGDNSYVSYRCDGGTSHFVLLWSRTENRSNELGAADSRADFVTHFSLRRWQQWKTAACLKR